MSEETRLTCLAMDVEALRGRVGKLEAKFSSERMQGRCESCRHWNAGWCQEIAFAGKAGEVCEEKCGGGLYTGPRFGCVHWEGK
jgi:hypothetical protein